MNREAIHSGTMRPASLASSAAMPQPVSLILTPIQSPSTPVAIVMVPRSEIACAALTSSS